MQVNTTYNYNSSSDVLEKIRKIEYQNKEILIIDYSECKEEMMIEIFERAKCLILAEGKKVLVLSVLSNNYLTPDFIRNLEEVMTEVEVLIEKNAIIGVTEIQKWIIKGMNLWYKPQVHIFYSFPEALEFLVAEE